MHGHDHDIDPVHLIIAWLGTVLPRDRAFSEPRVSGTYTLGDRTRYFTLHASSFGRYSLAHGRDFPLKTVRASYVDVPPAWFGWIDGGGEQIPGVRMDLLCGPRDPSRIFERTEQVLRNVTSPRRDKTGTLGKKKDPETNITKSGI